MIVIDFNLKYNFIITNFINFYIRIVIDSDILYYSFINRSVFIIYEKINIRFIKNIENNQIYFFNCEIIEFQYFIKDHLVIIILFNALYIPDINVNFLLINKFLNIDFTINFFKTDYIFIINDVIFINIRNRDFFLDI